MSSERARLLAATERLEAVSAALAAGVPPDELERLSQEALALSAEISEILPRALREADEASPSGT